MSVNEQIDSLERAVQFGLLNGKRNVVADLVPLDELFQQRKELLAALEAALPYIPACPARGDAQDAIAKSRGHA